MNNLSLFTRAEFSPLFFFPCSARRLEAEAEILYISLAWDVCIAYARRRSTSQHFPRFSFILFRKHKKQIVNINSKLLNMHQFVLFAPHSYVHGNYSPPPPSRLVCSLDMINTSRDIFINRRRWRKRNPKTTRAKNSSNSLPDSSSRRGQDETEFLFLSRIKVAGVINDVMQRQFVFNFFIKINRNCPCRIIMLSAAIKFPFSSFEWLLWGHYFHAHKLQRASKQLEKFPHERHRK